MPGAGPQTPILPNPSDLTLSIGSIQFQNFEIPSLIDAFGGIQMLAVHDFPGGRRTIQDLGAFADPITWSGHLLVDALTGTPLDRVFQIDALRVSGQVLSLIYGPFNLDVVVKSFKPRPRFKYWIPYTITIVPKFDRSQSNVGSSNPTNSSTPSSAPTPSSQLADLQKYLTNPPNGTALPPATQSAAQNYQQSASNALQTAGNDVSNIPTSTLVTLHQQVLQIQQQLQSAITGSDPVQASTASDINSLLTLVDQQLNASTTQPTLTIPVINPNLYALAAEYYGDAQLWSVIGNANNIIDPFPTGTFNLVIPGVTPSSSPSVITDLSPNSNVA